MAPLTERGDQAAEAANMVFSAVRCASPPPVRGSLWAVVIPETGLRARLNPHLSSPSPRIHGILFS